MDADTGQGVVTYSLNELESLLKKAAVGAGLPVGHAVAIAGAGVWLARRKLPVCEIIARAVADGVRESAVESGGTGLAFKAARAAVDGPAAIDLLLAGTVDETITLNDVDEPALLVGLAGAAAQVHGVSIALDAGDGEMVLGVGAEIVPAEWRAAGKRTLVMRQCNDLNGGDAGNLATRYDPAACADSGWDQLVALAHRTYVPASDQSRLSGAGAGLTDND